MHEYQSFNNTATGPIMNHNQISNNKKNGKMFVKEPIGSRRNSQDKMQNNSLIHNNNSMIGGYCPQENVNKNRP